MKLVIPGGEPTEHVLYYLQNFFEESGLEHPRLKGNMTIYLHLVGAGNKECSKNSGEYVLTEAGFVTHDQFKAMEPRKKLERAWADYIEMYRQRMYAQEVSIEGDRRYLAELKENRGEPHEIKGYEEFIKEEENKLADAAGLCTFMDRLDNMKKNNEGIDYFSREDVTGRASCLIFLEVKGGPWHFIQSLSNDGERFTKLCLGLPQGYKNASNDISSEP